MNDKIKQVNPQKFSVGVKTLNRPDGFNIAPGSFAMVSADDVSYIASISSILERGILRLENTADAKADFATEALESVGINPESNPNYIDDEDIKKHQAQSVKKIEEWLNGITEAYIQDRIYDVVISMDNMPMNKLKVIKEKMPDRDFIGE